jgi:hypothetical protein
VFAENQLGRPVVTGTNYHPAVGEALAILIDGLAPFVQDVSAKALPPSVPWTELLRRKDAAAGRQMGTYRDGDLSLMLGAMTERLGEYGFPFSRHLCRSGQNYASELRDVSNRWAHNESFPAWGCSGARLAITRSNLRLPLRR